MAFGLTAIAAATIGAGASIYAANQASNAQQNAANTAANTQQGIFNQQVALNQPFYQGSIAAQNQLLTYLGLTPKPGSGVNVNPNDPNFGLYAQDFGMDDFQADPGYAFRLEQGMKALQNSAAAKGLLSSGNTLKGITDYGQNAASQEYMNAFNRYQINRANRINPLLSVMGSGQTAANTLTNAGSQLGQGLSQAQVAAGNAQASGYINMGNALNNALTGGMNSYTNYNNMQQYLAGIQGSSGLGGSSAGSDYWAYQPGAGVTGTMSIGEP